MMRVEIEAALGTLSAMKAASSSRPWSAPSADEPGVLIEEREHALPAFRGKPEDSPVDSGIGEPGEDIRLGG